MARLVESGTGPEPTAPPGQLAPACTAAFMSFKMQNRDFSAMHKPWKGSDHQRPAASYTPPPFLPPILSSAKLCTQ